MPLLNNAYAQALQAPGPAAPQGPTQPPAPMPAPMPTNAPDISPMTQQGDIFFIDPAMLTDPDCKVGDEIMLKASIQSKGSKIGLQPLEVVMESEAPDEEGEDQEGY